MSARQSVITCYTRGNPEEGRSVTLCTLLQAEVNLPLGLDMANWSPFNFDKYSLFNLGPVVIQNYQEAILAIFMNSNISLILKSCFSFV